MRERRALKPKDLVNWDPKQHTLIDRYVQALMDILEIDEEQRVFTNKPFLLDIYVKILSENIRLLDIASSETKGRLIRNAAFSRLKRYKVQGAHTFRQALAAEVRQFLTRPMQEYWILFPIHIMPAQLERFRSFTVLDTKIIVRQWSYISKNFELDPFLRDVSSRFQGQEIPLQTNFTPLMSLVKGQDRQEALDGVVRVGELLRVLINLPTQFGRVSGQFGGFPRPLARILPAPVYAAFDREGKYATYWYHTRKYERYGQNFTSTDQIDSARQLARRLRSSASPNNTVWLVIEALEKYGQALDTSEWQLAFLILWQILELLTLQSPEQLTMKSVVGRINMLLGQSKLIKDLMPALCNTRNELVHRGHFPEQQGLEEVNLLKYVVEESIDAVFSQMRVLSTKQSLARYYDHASSATTDLADRNRVIAHIQRNRKKQ